MATAWILILSEVQDLVKPGCNLRFHNISAQEYSYIEDQLKGLDIHARMAYFDNLEQFIVTMPHNTHKALVVPFIIGMGTSFEAIPLSRGPYTIAVEVAPHISICSLTGSDDLDLTTMHPYIFMEMIKIKETYNAPSQSPSLPNVKHFKGREFLTQTLYLTLSTSDLDALIDRTMNKFKKIIIQYMEDMLASTSSISSDLDLENQLGDLDEGESMWKTMHTHYKSWHAHLPKHPLSEVNDDKGGGPANVSWPAIKCINLS
ncbi:hypothetical protein EDD16DRAFT_1515245 [Pisolithus croceorrhizus]|nr:hypothetical protein EDD16DRAFT_1515245 [Pisolithus croceorrhizus]